jgi:hypothetical protein
MNTGVPPAPGRTSVWVSNTTTKQSKDFRPRQWIRARCTSAGPYLHSRLYVRETRKPMHLVRTCAYGCDCVWGRGRMSVRMRQKLYLNGPYIFAKKGNKGGTKIDRKEMDGGVVCEGEREIMRSTVGNIFRRFVERDRLLYWCAIYDSAEINSKWLYRFNTCFIFNTKIISFKYVVALDCTWLHRDKNFEKVAHQ